MLVTGGLGKDGKGIGDAWILDVNSGKWRKVRRKCSVSGKHR